MRKGLLRPQIVRNYPNPRFSRKTRRCPEIPHFQRTAKGASGKGTTSKHVKKCEEYFGHFSTFFTQGKNVKNRQKFLARILAERIFLQIFIFCRRIFSRTVSPVFFSLFCGKKCPEKILQENPRQNPPNSCISGGVRVRFRVLFQAVKVPIFGGFPVENPTKKANRLKALPRGTSLSEYGLERFRVRLRRLSEYGSVAYLVERPTREIWAEQYSDTVLALVTTWRIKMYELICRIWPEPGSKLATIGDKIIALPFFVLVNHLR